MMGSITQCHLHIIVLILSLHLPNSFVNGNCNGFHCDDVGQCDEDGSEVCRCYATDGSLSTTVSPVNGVCATACTGEACLQRGLCTVTSGINGACACAAGGNPDADGECTDPCAGRPCITPSASTGICSHVGSVCSCQQGMVFNDDDECVDDCLGFPCKDAGNCHDIDGKCTCKYGLMPSADTNFNCIDDCAGKACAALSTPNCKTINKDCSCQNGLIFDGTEQNCIEPCTGKTCFTTDDNCRNENEKCLCDDGLFFDQAGTRCIDKCDLRTCQTSVLAPCSDVNGICSCQAGLVWLDSNENVCVLPCHDKTCLSELTCESLNGRCVCKPGLYFDDVYQRCIDKCDQKACDGNPAAPCKDINRICTCQNGLVWRDLTENECVQPCTNKACWADGKCENQDGKCVCNVGLRFDDVKNRCIDACDGRQCSRDSRCYEVNRRCLCQEGWIFDSLEEDCVEPCYGKACLISSTCRTVSGECQCNPGRRFDQERQECLDLNECGDIGICRSNEQCTNVAGSFSCTCRAGFAVAGVLGCEDIDECSPGISLCGENFVCQNTIGSYTCQCSNNGFTLEDGRCIKTTNILFILVIALGAVLVILVLSCGVWCCVFRLRRPLPPVVYQQPQPYASQPAVQKRYFAYRPKFLAQ